MPGITRRSALQATAALIPLPSFAISKPRRTDVRIKDISFSYEDFQYRTPYKFGGRLVDRVTLLNVRCAVEDGSGRVAHGTGSMPLGNVWSFPSSVLPYDATLTAMKTVAERIAAIFRSYREFGHPIHIGWTLEPECLKAAAAVTTDLELSEPIPKLCTLVTGSPFDAAVHDAYGKLHGLNCYRTYGPDFVSHDLGHYLGPEYKGEYASQYVSAKPAEKIALYHSVGASDPITESDVQQRIKDGLPETLPEWIRYNGVRRIKIKLNGDDVAWDIDRVCSIDRATTETQARLNISDWFYSLDFNERCPNVAYLLAFLRKLKERAPGGFERIQYIEQPTRRDLKRDRQNVMHEAAKLRPVVIDESLTDVEALLLAREMGYTGAALKACKGQTQVLLMSAVAQKKNMFLCVQDLTCPGASLIHSAGLAAHVPGVTAIEANAREYVPAANKPWEQRYPGVFLVRDGYIRTDELNRPGLST